MTEELKPCPFCGSYAELYHGTDHSKDMWRVQCNYCKCGTIEFTVPFMAVDKWNERAVDEA